MPSLEENGALRLYPAAYYDTIDSNALQVWCNRNARYGLPTIELVDWLRNYIGDRTAIEIGAGSGDLCRHLGIVGTDNHQQAWPLVQQYYAALGQPTIKYAPWVQEMDALDAVRKYKPDIVIASWVTHWIDPTLPPPPGGGNMYGVKEDELLELVDEYLLIGNLGVHGTKPIRSLPHQELEFNFIKSRAFKPELDRIFIW